MSALVKILAAGAGIGFLGAIGIVFDPREPYPGFIVAGGTIAGALLALMIRSVVEPHTPLRAALAWGGFIGLLQGAMIYLSKGGWESSDAPFVVPTLAISGMLLAPIVRRLRRSA